MKRDTKKIQHLKALRDSIQPLVDSIAFIILEERTERLYLQLRGMGSLVFFDRLTEVHDFLKGKGYRIAITSEENKPIFNILKS